MNQSIGKILSLGTVIVIVLTVAGCSARSPVGTVSNSIAGQTLNESVAEGSKELPTYGSSAALADDSLSLEEMLVYAIEDEYAARAEYDLIVEKFGNVNPYYNIIRSEESHILKLKALFETYNIPLPEDTGSEHIVTPANLTDAASTGVSAEKSNIAMYDKFLSMNLPDDVKAVFVSLKNASLGHLSAFQNKI